MSIPADWANASAQSIKEAASFMHTSLPESLRRRLGKMRQEMPRQIVRGQQRRRRLSGEVAEVADQGRLVVIPAGNRRRGPIQTPILDGCEAALKPPHPREHFRRQ